MTAPWVSVETFAKASDTDDTAAFARALEQHERILVPERARPYVIRAGDAKDDMGKRYAAMLPSHRTLHGLGNPVIRTVLPDATNLDGINDSEHPNVVHFLTTERNAQDIDIEGLTFEGEGPELTTANWIVNPHPSVVQLIAPKNAAIRHCHFRRQIAFPVHGGEGYGVEYTDNTHTDCMNGVNINTDGILAERNTFSRSEGFEASESFGWYLDNEFFACSQAFSIGGNMHDRGASVAREVVVRRNLIDGIVWLAEWQHPGSAIVIADNIDGVTVEKNTIRRAAGNGIHVHAHPQLRPTRNVRLIQNTLEAVGLVLDDTGRRNEWSRYPIFVEHIDGVTTRGNKVRDTDPRYSAKAGVFVRESKDIELGPDEIEVTGQPYLVLGSSRREARR